MRHYQHCLGAVKLERVNLQNPPCTSLMIRGGMQSVGGVIMSKNMQQKNSRSKKLNKMTQKDIRTDNAFMLCVGNPQTGPKMTTHSEENCVF